MRRVAAGAALLVAVVVAAVLVLHAPPVRRAVLRYAVETLETRYRLRLDAGGLNYNLATLGLTLTQLRVAANHTPDMPFFEAARVRVRLARSSLGGPLAFDDIEVQEGRVRIVRTTSGSNLPLLDDEGGGEPQPLRIGRLSAPDLSITVQDEVTGTTVQVPAAMIEIGSETGRIALAQPARVGFDGRGMEVSRLEGALRFDGRTLTAGDLQLVTPELAIRLDGSIGLMVNDPAVQLDVRGSADLGELAPWVGLDPEVLAGTVSFEGGVSGPVASPAAEFDATAPSVRWQELQLRDLALVVRASPERIDVTEAEASLAGGTLSASARVDLDAAGVREVSASWRDVGLEPLSAAFGDASNILLTGRVSGDLQARQTDPTAPWTAGMRVAVTDGVTEGRRVALPGESQLRVVDGRWQLDGRHLVGGIAAVALDLRGSLVNGGLEALPVSGVIRVDPVDAAVALDTLQMLDIVRVPAGLALEGRVSSEIGVSGTIGAPRLTVDASLAQGRIAIEGLTAGLQGRVRAEGAMASLRGSGVFEASDTRWNDMTVGAIVAQIELDADEARLTATAPAFNASASAVVMLAAPHATVVDLNAASLDLALLARRVEQLTRLSGRADVVAHAEGTLDAWRTGTAWVSVDALDARLGELPVRLEAPARASYADERLTIETLEATAAAIRISASGALPLSAPDGVPPSPADTRDAIVLSARGDAGDVAQAIDLTGLADLPLVGGAGPVELTASVGRSVNNPDLSARLDVGPATLAFEDLPLVSDVVVRARLVGRQLDVPVFGARYQEAQVTAAGSVPVDWFFDPAPAGTSSTPARLSAQVVGLGPESLEPFLDPATLSDLSGSLDVSLDVSSAAPDVSQATGTISIDRLDVRIADLPVTQRSPTRVTLEDGFARIASWDWAGQGITLNVAGQVRLSDLQAGIVATGALDARLLTPFVRDAGVATAGTLVPRLSITGPLTAPRVDGDMTIAGGEVRLSDPRIIVTSLDGRVLLTRSTATLTDLTGTINGGSLSASGAAELNPGDTVRGTVTAEIRNMPLEMPDGLRSEVDADLTLTATRELDVEADSTSARLEGTVTVLRGSYREPLAVLGSLFGAAQRPQPGSAPAQESAFLQNLALDVRLVTDEDLIVNNNTARLAAGADLRILGTASMPTVAGRVDLREGGQVFLGRNVYEITSGRIDFADPLTIAPELDVELTTTAGGEDIDVSVSGRVNAPSVALSSSNPDLTQADLTALLVTGQSFDDLASADAALIGATVVGNLSGDVLGFAGQAVGLDTLRLGGVETETMPRDITALASEVDPTSRLTFGKSIGRYLDVTLSQSLRDGDALTWIVDYLPSRRILLRLVSDDDDLRTYAFRHDVAFGAPRVERQAVSSRVTPPRVAAVRLEGTLAFPERQLRGLLELAQGDRFDFVEWQDDRERLERFYRNTNHLAARIRATRSDSPDGVTLDYAIEAGPETRIQVEGWAPDENTVEQLRDAWELAIVDELLVDEAQGIVRDALMARGYLRPVAEASIGGDGDVRTLTVRVDPGVQTRAARVAFNGVSDAMARELQTWSEGERALQAARDPAGYQGALTAFLSSRGYVDPQVRVGAAVLTGDEAQVPVTIAAGTPLRIDVVRFEGNTLPDDRLAAAAAIESGAPASPAALDAARTRLLALYRREGYPDADVTVEAARDAVIVRIDEGARQTISDIVVEGRHGVDADVVARAIDLAEGDPLRVEDLLSARQRLLDSGLFRRVDVTTERVEPGDDPPAASPLPMRVRVSLEEWPSLRVRYGIDVAEERPDDDPSGRDLVPGLSAELTRRTLFGRPIAVGATGRYQRRQRQARVYITAPTFAALPVQSFLTLERARQEFAAATLVSDVTGLAWEQRTRVARRLQLSYAYRFERNHTFDTNPNPNDPLPFDLVIDVARVLGSASWDSRSQPDDPSSGMFLSSTIEYAPAWLGSDFDFVRYVAQAYRFTPWRRVVLASAARFGAVRAFAGQDVIPSERFFAGGARSVRGVSEDGLGEQDFLGDPVGGEALLLLNQEVRFPIFRWLRGVGFLDAGNVFSTPADLSLGDLTVSAGVGLRVTTPFALLRVDVGRVLDTGGSRWTFGIGHAF